VLLAPSEEPESSTHATHIQEGPKATHNAQNTLKAAEKRFFTNFRGGRGDRVDGTTEVTEVTENCS
jgi:hypothetical protein